MEQGVYICSWSRSSEGFAVWVKSRPKIRASSPTHDEAAELLCYAIQDAGGAMHPVLEFDPPRPVSDTAKKYSKPELYLIGGDERFLTDSPRERPFECEQQKEDRLRWLDEFYEKPVCRRCGQTTGKRSGKPVTLTYAPSKADGAFGSIGWDGSNPNHEIVSEEFLSLLTEAEHRRLEFRQVIRKGRRKFYELIGPEGLACVAVAGVKTSGWRCAQCGYRLWNYVASHVEIGSYIARSDLPARSRGVFTVGVFPEIQLAVAAARWKEMRGQRGTRGFVSDLLGVVPDDEVVRRPDLPPRDDTPPVRSFLGELLGDVPDNGADTLRRLGLPASGEP